MRAYPSSSSSPAAAMVSPEQQSAAGQVVAWLRGKWLAFKALDSTIQDLQHRTATAAYAALQRGDTQTNALAKESIERLGELRQLHQRATTMFESISAQIPSLQGLGALPVVPIALVASVLILGAMVTYIFSRVGAEQRIVQLLELGQLTPEEARRLLENTDEKSPAEEFAGTVKWILLGLLGFMAVKTIREAIAR